MRHIFFRKSLLGTHSRKRRLFRQPVTSLIMKRRAQDHGKRSQLSALMPVVALLMAATLAKFAAATQFFHLSH
jgi:hypothetical protein